MDYAEDFSLRIMGRHPRVTGLLLVAASLFIICFVLSGSVFLVIAFAFTVSPEASKMVLWLGVGLWISILVPILMLVDRSTSMRRSTRRLLTRAEAGEKEAMWRLVDVYMKGGYGLAKDYSQANWWLQNLAKNGDSEAAYLLHEHLRQGIGTFRNHSGSKDWLCYAATLGHAKAAAILADEDVNPKASGSEELK